VSQSDQVRRQFDMSEIVITGSTGVIGRRAVREVLAAGHSVTGVTRSADGRRRLKSLGAHAVDADVFDEASLRRAFDGVYAVINLLTHVPSADRMTDPSAWAENDRLRTAASASVARAASAAGVRRLVQESIAFVYADGGDEWLDEDAPVAGGGITTSALTAERNAGELFDGDTVVLRFGLFMGSDSGSTLAMLEAGRSGTVGGVNTPRSAHVAGSPRSWSMVSDAGSGGSHTEGVGGAPAARIRRTSSSSSVGRSPSVRLVVEPSTVSRTKT
jgi:UDP-glucose 4-epimerase